MGMGDPHKRIPHWRLTLFTCGFQEFKIVTSFEFIVAGDFFTVYQTGGQFVHVQDFTKEFPDLGH
jgi:hypothetical protein